jgi:hypothetical protein
MLSNPLIDLVLLSPDSPRASREDAASSRPYTGIWVYGKSSSPFRKKDSISSDGHTRTRFLSVWSPSFFHTIVWISIQLFRVSGAIRSRAQVMPGFVLAGMYFALMLQSIAIR